jgi:predicted nucleic acid-binding protein
MRSSTKTRRRVSSRDRGVLDTSVIIDITEIDVDMLPRASSIASLTLAELTSGPLSTNDQGERAERSERLQWAESTFEAIPFDVAAARAYGRVYAASLAAKQEPRGARAVDLLIAATALSRGLPLYTRNPTDFRVVAKLLEIVRI